MRSTDPKSSPPHSNGLARRELLALAPAIPLALSGAANAADAVDPVGALVAEFVRAGRADGLSVAVVHGGRTRFHNAGVIARDARTPATERSVYEIGSISKTFTGLLLAHAIGEGKAAASDDVRRHLPPGYDNLERDGRPVRLIDLVDTTSALPDSLPDWRQAVGGAKPAEIPFIAAKLLDGYTSQTLMADLRTASLVDTPGRVPRHSNVASQLVGIVLERLYGRPYEALLAQYVETPLGMGSGAAAPPPALLALGYDHSGPATPALAAPVIRAAGGLRYSAADMARYLAAQLAARDPAIALTHQPAWGSPDAAAIGFHWMIAKTADSQVYLRHSGGTFGFSSYCDFYPGQGYGIVLLANRAGLQDALQSAADAAHEALFGRPRGLVALEAALERSRYADVGATVADTRRRFPELHLSEDYVNAWGYRLLRAPRPTEARAMLGYNAAQRPDSWNAHDSYAEALAAAGDKTQAVAEYRRSLALNPANDNAEKMIARISAGQ
ncbi:serine hydrolase domain-containing protein [Caulobacter sp. UNC279MFTsu5.1]|uniref:serine hydrolase domain-containing protein n=1 Tax=Caulobacter sp. UNC279MFTsu5.1 TaxID=1502775 RepID=UPI00037032F2|nr:serine hydrolase domain-containing protein [Caulobacter sp. UNC279MFTsu5.1]SFJ72470.1 CubicO group peptidase, beta-lactamase class C family [Caulobacter sp. UNC279MFTsu5.1]